MASARHNEVLTTWAHCGEVELVSLHFCWSPKTGIHLESLFEGLLPMAKWQSDQTPYQDHQPDVWQWKMQVDRGYLKWPEQSRRQRKISCESRTAWIRNRKQCWKSKTTSWVVVVHAFHPSTWEAEAGRALSSRPAWSTEWVPGWPAIHRENCPKKQTKQTNKKKRDHLHSPEQRGSQANTQASAWRSRVFGLTVIAVTRRKTKKPTKTSSQAELRDVITLPYFQGLLCRKRINCISKHTIKTGGSKLTRELTLSQCTEKLFSH